MITAVDTNIFIDILATASEFALRRAKQSGTLIVSMVCYAELAARFTSRALLDSFLESLGCDVIAMDAASAYRAGRLFREYRDRGGQRNRILPDFMIGAHAESHADVLLTRDKRFHKEKLTHIVVIDPDNVDYFPSK